MARTRSGMYPEVFMRVAMSAWERKECERIAVVDERASRSQLHNFHRFRNSLIEEGSPFAYAAKDLIARRVEENGKWFLTFTPSHLYAEKHFKDGGSPELKVDLPQPTGQALIDTISQRDSASVGSEKAEDPFEAAMLRYGYKPHEAAMTEEGVECEHDFDLGRCLKCGLPE